MTHRSRLGVIVIDCRVGDLNDVIDFWSAALGRAGKVDADGKYATFDGHSGAPRILLQKVDHDPRVHLDFETNDQPAEAARLTALGAREIAEIKNWTVMEAPTGHRFCLVDPQGPDFPGDAREWT